MDKKNKDPMAGRRPKKRFERVVKKGPAGKAEARTGRVSAPDDSGPKSAGILSHGPRTSFAMSSHVPAEIVTGAEELEARISNEMEHETTVERQFARVAVPEKPLYSGVPMSETLETDPEKIAEYCKREPFLLTDRLSMAKSPKFGIIDARFKALAFTAELIAAEIAEMRDDLTGNVVPASYKVRAHGDEAFSEKVLRVLGGDRMDAEYDAAVKQAEKYNRAVALASDIYHSQMQKTFRQLEAGMTRRALGEYAQNIWHAYCLDMQKEYEYNEGLVTFNRRLFNEDVGETDDPLLQRFAALSAFQAMKWIAFNINEVPLAKSDRGVPTITSRTLN